MSHRCSILAALTTASTHPLDLHRDRLLQKAGISPAPVSDLVPAARDKLAELVEDELGVSGRDAVRIAHAWMTSRKTPTDYRMK